MPMCRNQYIARLAALHSSAADLTRGAGERYEVPVELVRYVDDGGNPDVWMAVAMRSTVAANQSSKGKVTAFR